MISNSVTHLPPFGNCLPGTELLRSPFRTEFSMGSLSWRYRPSLRRHRRFLRSYRRSLRRCRDPWGDRRTSGRRCRSLRDSLKIIKHSKTSWNMCKTLWYIVKRRKTSLTNSKTSCKIVKPLVKHYETSWNTLKTLWNTQTLSIQCDDIGARRSDIALGAATARSAQRYRRSARSLRRHRHGVSGDIGDCGVGIILQMCNRVTTKLWLLELTCTTLGL